MAKTFYQIYIQAIFSVKHRNNLLSKEWQDELFRYISGIISNKGEKSIIVNGHKDHIHLLFSIRPSKAISDLVRDVKNNSSKFINERGFVNCRFEWQDGFGSFSYGRSQLDMIYKYILNQEKHHKNKSFKKEYLTLLEKYEVPFEQRHLFKWIE